MHEGPQPWGEDKTNEQVKSISKEKNIWKIHTQGWTYEGYAVILANGSRASSISGSDGSGYEIAAALGHSVITPLPALTALKCKNTGFSGWAGVRTEGKISLYADGKKIAEETGELQLTDYGVSGIPVFQISRYAIRAFWKGQKTERAEFPARIFQGTTCCVSGKTKTGQPL